MCPRLLNFFIQRPWLERYLCSWFAQGGGLDIDGTATLTNTNVYNNQADIVCSPFEHSLNFHPAPRWNVTRSALFACRVVDSTSLARRR